MKVRIKLHQRYDGAELLGWTRQKTIGGNQYEAKVNFNKETLLLLYNEEKGLLKEATLDEELVLPLLVKFHVGRHYSGFVMSYLARVKIYEDRSVHDPVIYYELAGKAGKEFVVVKYDLNNEVIIETDHTTIAESDF